MFNISYTKNGGLRFVRIGRLTLSFSVMSYATWEKKAEHTALVAIMREFNLN